MIILDWFLGNFMTSILDLGERIGKLGKKDAELFSRLFWMQESVGELAVPAEMRGWVEKTFGSTDAVERQRTLRIRNRLTGEETLYNALRASRPTVKGADNSGEIGKKEGCAFCSPRSMTPEDPFGRVQGAKGISASNVAKYDKWHGLVIFDGHDPRAFDETSVKDYLGIAREWIGKAYAADAGAIYPFIVWQCLWRSGASIIHGHLQALLAQERHYPAAEDLNAVRLGYEREFDAGYFTDLFRVHEALGLAIGSSIKVIAHLTPKKENEVLVIGEFDETFFSTLYRVIACLRDDLGTDSFNVGIMLPPVVPDSAWNGFPAVARIIDRGPLENKTSDFASMEIFSGASVVSSDPYLLIGKLRKRL